MQNLNLTNGLEAFFQSSHPNLSVTNSASAGIYPIENTSVVQSSGSTVVPILKLFAFGGLICLGLYLFDKYLIEYKRDDSNKPF